MRLQIFILIAFFSALSVVGHAQAEYDKVMKKAENEAKYYMELDDYLVALEKLRFVYERDTNSAELNFNIGKCLIELKGDKREAIKYFEHASRNGINEARFYLSRCYHSEERFNESIAMLTKYKSFSGEKKYTDEVVDRNIEIAKRASAMSQKPLHVEIENIGSPINSDHSDYVPLINADESMMIFTSRREGSTGGKVDYYGENYEDVYISRRENDAWGPPQKLSSHINGELHDAAVGLSADGNTLIIYRISKKNQVGKLYESAYVGADWTEPRLLENNINSKYVETSASVSADGLVMYFSSNRPGGHGGMDIYRVKKMDIGQWSQPYNLGPTVNSEYDEIPSFVDPDDHTLFFQSKGHTTMGGFDIFKTTFDSEGKWTKPENIGYPINTVNDDLHFVLSSDGERGYYSTVSNSGRGDQDIYVIRMPYPPRLLTVVKGAITTSDGVHLPVQGRIIVRDNNNVIHGEYKSNVLTGKYLIILNPNIEYSITFEADGFDSKVSSLEFKREDSVKESKLDVQLDRLN